MPRLRTSLSRFRGRSTLIAGWAWVVVAAAVTVTWAAAVVAQWGTMTSICHAASSCANFQLDASTARLLGEHDIAIVAYAVYTAIVVASVWLIWCGLAALILWRKSDDPGALVSAFFLILFPLFEISFWLPSSPSWLAALGLWMGRVAFVALLFFCLLFPTGRYVPAWARWLAPVFVGLAVVNTVLPVSPAGLSTVLAIAVLFAAVASQVYRFRALATWAQRQQTKWAFVGLLVTLVGLIALLVPFFVRPALGQGGTGYEVFTVTGVPIVTSIIPVTVGIAILRSGLWDIDRVISRALAYAALTISIAGVYVGGVIGLQSLFALFVGNGSPAAIALSTLVIVAIFGPLRRRIQSTIDRRFYRSKYDAQRTLASFSERLRDEVDLSNLSHNLSQVVHETLRPEHVSLWLREPGGARIGPA